MSGPLEIVLIIAAICYVLGRRLLGEPAEAKRMLVLPAVLTVIGLSNLTGALTSPVAIVFLAGSIALSVLLGLARGATVKLSQRNGFVMMRYTAMTVVLWVVNIAVKLGAGVLLGLVDPAAAHSSSNTLMLTMGVGMLVEGLTVLAKAMRGNGRIIWQQGKDGQPHTTSPFLDQLQQRVQGVPADAPTYPTAQQPTYTSPTYAEAAFTGRVRDRRDRRARRTSRLMDSWNR